jgi:GrpB-like predicted nucleotidyltransferase (UPF0157 family)
MRPVEIVDYDERWPEIFKQLREALKGAFGEEALDVQHIGSTSVPGLAAKPVIDVAVSLRTYPLPPYIVSAMEALGYESRGEFGIKGRHYFVKYENGTDEPGVHVHSYSPGNPEWDAHIVFRDYLRAHPEAAHDYERLKRDLAARYRLQREVYTNSKSNFVVETLEKGRAWRETLLRREEEPVQSDAT